MCSRFEYVLISTIFQLTPRALFSISFPTRSSTVTKQHSKLEAVMAAPNMNSEVASAKDVLQQCARNLINVAQQLQSCDRVTQTSQMSPTENRQTNVLWPDKVFDEFAGNVLFPRQLAVLLFLSGTRLPNHLFALQTKNRRCHQVSKRKSNLVLLNLVKERLYLKGTAIQSMSIKKTRLTYRLLERPTSHVSLISTTAQFGSFLYEAFLYVLRIFRYSGLLWVVLTNTGIFLRALKLCGESRT